MTPTTIEKEQVDSLRFPASEVLDTSAQIDHRAAQLKKAVSLGNLDKIKVKIIFEDSESLRLVHTTIWAVTEQKIALKGGVTIPRNRIHSIQLIQD